MDRKMSAIAGVYCSQKKYSSTFLPLLISIQNLFCFWPHLCRCEWSLSWEAPFIAAVCLLPACGSSPVEINILLTWPSEKIFPAWHNISTFFFPNSIKSVGFMYNNIFWGHYVTPRGFLVKNEGKVHLQKIINELEIRVVLPKKK